MDKSQAEKDVVALVSQHLGLALEYDNHMNGNIYAQDRLWRSPCYHRQLS